MKLKTNTLRSFITFAVVTTVAVSLLGASLLFYTKSANTLKENYKSDMVRQLQQINTQVETQIGMVDSIYPLIMSNTLIREYLDPASAVYGTKNSMERRLEIERQLSYLLISTFLWDEKFINSVYIFDENGTYSKVSLYKYGERQSDRMRSIYAQVPEDSISLEMRTLREDNRSVYFARNIKSSYTGDNIATIIIDINQDNWKKSYGGNADENWLICIFNKEMQMMSHENPQLQASYEALMQETKGNETPMREVKLGNTRYYMASRTMPSCDITSAVAVPEAYLMRELNEVLRTFLTIFLLIILITLVFAFVLSRAITAPIETMISYVKTIADGKKPVDTTPPVSMYIEFNQLADAFDVMLKQLDVYYRDNYEKQLLLKNTEIKALQSQMDPHFLFNILDTVAWKAQMSDSEDIYQMIISLGELLRSNILSKEKDFVTLEEELSYVRFYIYLQQTRFEDKFTAEIHLESYLNNCMVPRFCIQPLVENAVVHGLEPKSGFGRLMVNIIDQGEFLEINVADNGVGFRDTHNLNELKPEKDSGHTHIGLKNLNRRLTLLYGEQAGLQITSRPNEFTAISFRIPKKQEEEI